MFYERFGATISSRHEVWMLFATASVGGRNTVRAALTFKRLEMAAMGSNIAVWSRASWFRRKRGAALLLPLVSTLLY